MALGLREFYVTLCLLLSVFVTLTILAEFYRGARVISARTGSNLLSSASQLTMRNTRRYGGYVVHFGMVLVFIGISGQAFNQDKQMDMSAGSRDEHRAIYPASSELRFHAGTELQRRTRHH